MKEQPQHSPTFRTSHEAMRDMALHYGFETTDPLGRAAITAYRETTDLQYAKQLERELGFAILGAADAMDSTSTF